MSLSTFNRFISNSSKKLEFSEYQKNDVEKRNDFDIVYDSDLINIKDEKNQKVSKRNCDACICTNEVCVIF